MLYTDTHTPTPITDGQHNTVVVKSKTPSRVQSGDKVSNKSPGKRLQGQQRQQWFSIRPTMFLSTRI